MKIHKIQGDLTTEITSKIKDYCSIDCEMQGLQPGRYKLSIVSLTFDDAGDELCISGAILSDASANSYDVEVGDCFDGYGCMDMSACNFDMDATVDDGTCEYPEENFDCDGNCIVDVDCLGECGGDAIVDECGICNGSEENCVEGCTDLDATNYNIDAFVDDGYVRCTTKIV